MDRAIELLGNYVNYQEKLANMLKSGLTSLPLLMAQLDKITFNMGNFDITCLLLSFSF